MRELGENSSGRLSTATALGAVTGRTATPSNMEPTRPQCRFQSWEIWNEPNLNAAHFAPRPSAWKYARLVRISHDAITHEDPDARIVLGGMPGAGRVNAWTFLDQLYRQPGFRNSFDVAALQPYGRSIDEVAQQISMFRRAINRNSGRKTPVWITELGWGSGRPDRHGLSKGPVGQARLLTAVFKMILSHRQVWNVRRLFWFDWRDPKQPRTVKCTFCATAGLLNYDHSRKPAYFAFRRFASSQVPWSRQPPHTATASAASVAGTPVDQQASPALSAAKPAP